MRANRIIRLLFVCCLFLFPSIFHAQTLREPTAAEKTVIEKFVQVVQPIIDGFADSNWMKTDDGPDDPSDYSVQIKPDVVMGVAPFSDYHFQVAPNSLLWNSTIQPIEDSILNIPTSISPEELADLNEKLSNRYALLDEVVVEIVANDKNIDRNPISGSKEDLKISGCYFSYKRENDPFANVPGEEVYYLVFGNWQNAKIKYYSNEPFYEFPFTHPVRSPYIENVVIILKGNPKRIKELLHQTDWSKINDSLTL